MNVGESGLAARSGNERYDLVPRRSRRVTVTRRVTVDRPDWVAHGADASEPLGGSRL
jgi:hypothetical protein